MAKNHYSTKPNRRNMSGNRRDTRRIADTMRQLRELSRAEKLRKEFTLLERLEITIPERESVRA